MTRQGLLLLLGGLIVGVIAATHLPLRAQGNGKPQAEPAARGSSARASVQEAPAMRETAQLMPPAAVLLLEPPPQDPRAKAAPKKARTAGASHGRK